MSAIVASIGTTHPWNIAGIGLDVRVAAEFGVRAVIAIAAVSAQDAGGVRALFPIPADVLRAQLDALPDGVGAYRIGALGSPQNVGEVARFVRAHRHVAAVVDPVFAASLGGALADDATVAAFAAELLPEPSVVLTPNMYEAARLLAGPMPSRADDLLASARALRARGPQAVLLKGGHLAGDPADAFAAADEARLYTESRLPGSMRGTGCVLAMAIACELARGRTLRAAVESARAFVRERIAARAMLGGLQVAF